MVSQFIMTPQKILVIKLNLVVAPEMVLVHHVAIMMVSILQIMNI